MFVLEYQRFIYLITGLYLSKFTVTASCYEIQLITMILKEKIHDLPPDLSLCSSSTLLQLCQIMSVQATDILSNKFQKE